MNLTSLSHIWNVLVESNTFNFIIFVLLFVLLFKKINVNAMISSLRKKIVDILDEANREKEEAQKALQMAEKAVENLSTELEGILTDAEKSAEVISKKILTEAEKQIESIDANAKKVIEAEEKMLVSKLSKSASKASVEVAKQHIQSVLEQNPTLQDRYINESIDELDRLNF